MKHTLTATLIAMSLPFAVFAKDAAEHQHEQHDPHEHGAAQLNMVQEQQRLQIELKLSGMDVLGFEHAPSNAEQHAAVKQAEQQLSELSSLLIPSHEADCKIASAQAERVAIDHEEEHEEEHEKEHAAGHEEEHEEEHHAEFQVRGDFACQHPEQLKQIDVKLFSVFPSLSKIQAQIVTEKGQTATQLTAQHTRIELP